MQLKSCPGFWLWGNKTRGKKNKKQEGVGWGLLLPKLQSVVQVSPRHANKTLKTGHCEENDSIIYVSYTQETHLACCWESLDSEWLSLMCGTSELISMVSLEWAVCPVHCTIHGSLTHRPVRRREQTAVTIAKSSMSTGRTGYTAQTAVNIQRSLKTGPVTPLSRTNISLLIIILLMQKRTATVFNRSQPVMSCEDRLNSQSWMLTLFASRWVQTDLISDKRCSSSADVAANKNAPHWKQK